jgi:hypothetical protein
MNSISYCITESNMFLINAYSDPQLIPASLKEIDAKEKLVIDQETAYVKSYSKNVITAVKVSSVVFGAGIGIIISMLTISLFPLVNVNLLAASGIFIGSILGYLIGVVMDKLGASERAAIFFGKIAPNRVFRMEEKLVNITKIISEEKDEGALEKLNHAKNHVEKCLETRKFSSRFAEFVNF